MKKSISFIFIIILVTMIPLNLVLSDFIKDNEIHVNTVNIQSNNNMEEIIQVVPDPNFEDDSNWNFSSVTVPSPTSTLPNDPQGSWEYDTTEYVEGSRSVKITLTDNSTDQIYRTSVRGTSFLTYESCLPTRVTITWQMKARFTGTINPDSTSTYVRFHKPEDSPFQDYLYRAEGEQPYPDEWTTYNRTLPFLAVYYLFQKNSDITIELGAEFSNPFTHPPNPIPDPIEAGTAEFWFDNIQVLATQAIMIMPDDAFPSIEWNQTYGGDGSEKADTLIQTQDGGYAFAGSTTSIGSGERDIWLVKTNANGVVQWDQTYGGTNDDYVNALIQTQDGGYAFAGSTYSFGNDGDHPDMLFVQVDAEGEIQWDQTYGGTGNDEIHTLIQTTDGGFVLAGSTDVSGTWQSEMCLLKTDAKGNVIWNHTYGIFSYAYALVQTADGGYALAGNIWTEETQRDMRLVKTDTNGIIQWNQSYGGTWHDHAYALIQTKDKGFALVGYTYYTNTTPFSDMWLVKTDTNGIMQWNQTYGGNVDDEARSLLQTADEGFVIAGTMNSYSVDSDMFLLKTDSEGTLEWNQTYGRTGNDGASALLRTDDGCFVLAGFTRDCGGQSDVWLVKTEPVSIKTNGGINIFSILIFFILLIFSISSFMVLYRIYKRK
ncbi:MAG: hypothetical protein JSW11_05255 [Candidatus Heimdallarchaeota archaeon]|nr:MAG: hypothetical protein JSW11_05255 [Candidatus Heimdallarchaeota archaeon]